MDEMRALLGLVLLQNIDSQWSELVINSVTVSSNVT